jgi:hypothetical protein
MSEPVFIPQRTIDRWLDQGLAELEGRELVMPPTVRGPAIRLDVLPAVRFVAVEGSGEDRLGLVERVVTHDDLRRIHADPMGDSVLCGDRAYRVEPGVLLYRRTVTRVR